MPGHLLVRVVSFTVSSGSIQDFGLTSGTNTIVYAAGALYTYGTVTLTDATVFTDVTLTTAVSANVINGGSGGAIGVFISPKGGHGFDAVQELGGHYVMLNTLFIGAERDDLLTGNDFRNIAIVVDPKNYGTSTIASDQTARQTYALKLTSVSGTFVNDEKITQASTGAIGRVVEWDTANTILYYQQERYTDYGTNSLGAYVAFSGANAVTGADIQPPQEHQTQPQMQRSLLQMDLLSHFLMGMLIQNCNQTAAILYIRKTDHLSPVPLTKRKISKL
jgi:hypothetical protein